MDGSLALKVNGQEKTVPSGWTLEDLLRSLELDKPHVAVEWNRRIVRRGSWPDIVLSQGDQLEIVHFVGGGEGIDE